MVTIRWRLVLSTNSNGLDRRLAAKADSGQLSNIPTYSCPRIGTVMLTSRSGESSVTPMPNEKSTEVVSVSE